jgi:WD40 repeat protein
VRVWDLESGDVRTFGPLPGAGETFAGGVAAVHFAGRDRLYASIIGTGVVSIDLANGTNHLVVPQSVGEIVVSRDGRFGVGAPLRQGLAERGDSPVFRFSLENGSAETLSSHGKSVTAVALDPKGTMVASASFDGTIRVGPVSGEEPHLLLGQEGEGAIYSLAFSPDGQWLAASGESFTIHVWPVPDVSKPLLHRRAHDDLLALLRTHTNLVAVADPASSSGYRLEAGPFRGWAALPEW